MIYRQLSENKGFAFSTPNKLATRTEGNIQFGIHAHHLGIDYDMISLHAVMFLTSLRLGSRIENAVCLEQAFRTLFRLNLLTVPLAAWTNAPTLADNFHNRDGDWVLLKLG